ncbi:MAG: transposase, partial [Xenococcaceae cyanobacterium MO_188.B32]|nr:transposase [Xenococcaceae cyanobacterium MO_188.B32]
MKNDFVSSARSVSDMKAHLVLTTKYRKKVLTGQMISRLREVVTDLCDKWDCKVIAGLGNFSSAKRAESLARRLIYLHGGKL